MKRLAWILAGVVFMNGMSPVWGDVIPSKPGPADRERTRRVTVELVRKGVPPAAAHDQVGQLTDRDLSYLSESPHRIQLAGGLLLEEWVIGGVLLGSMLFMTMLVLSDA